MNDSPLIVPDAGFIEKFTGPSLKPKKVSSTAFRVDAHVDLPYYMMSHGIELSFEQLDSGPFTLQRARETNTQLFCTAVFCEDSFNGPGSEARYQEVLDFALSHLNTVQIVTRAQDLDAIDEDSERLFTILTLENADFLADNPVDNVARLVQDGVRIVSLTHIGKNRLADGNGVQFAEGISDLGREVIGALVDRNIVIDTAHLHPKSFWQLMDITDRSLVCTHTGVQEVCQIPRNLSLNQTKEIIDRGGVIGISLNPEMLSTRDKIGIQTVFAHVDTIVQRFDANSVGIGSDLGGFDSAPAELLDPEAVVRLEEEMRRHGYDESAVQAIMGGNWLRFFQQNL